MNRRSPEQTLIAGRQRHGEDGANDNRIVDDDERGRGMMRARQLPLLRSWSARSAETREVLVRFQRVALVVRAGGYADPHAAKMRDL